MNIISHNNNNNRNKKQSNNHQLKSLIKEVIKEMDNPHDNHDDDSLKGSEDSLPNSVKLDKYKNDTIITLVAKGAKPGKRPIMARKSL